MKRVTANMIYQIKSITNDKLYIGSTIDYNKRIKVHLGSLRRNKHHSILLQRHYNKYGEKDLVFSILELVMFDNDLVKKEQYYLDVLNPKLNICKIAGSQLGMKRSIETRRKMSISSMGNIVNVGRIQSEEHKRKVGLANLGKVRTPEQRKKMSDNHKGKDCGIRHLQYIKDNISYKTQTALAKELDIHQSTISKLLKYAI